MKKDIMDESLQLYLKTVIHNGGSDLHLKSGAVARVRIDGELKIIGEDTLSPKLIETLLREITTKEQFIKLREDRQLDFTYILGEEYRFRVNAFYQMDGLSVVFRVIPIKITSLEELNLPEIVQSFTEMSRGLVLVTGVTGSGKSTTITAMLDKINKEKSKHIITIEDPIEFVHQDKGCLINQRAVGQDTHNFYAALTAGLREDPDIILVGEMRDLETIDMALHAANTGHLVFSTLHTLDAKETIDRIIGMFDGPEQNRIRGSLASVLEGVISQRLVPAKNGGRIPAVEILKKTARIEQLILEERDNEIPDALADGKDIYNTQTFDQSLLDLLKRDAITEDVALEYATNVSDMKLTMSGIGDEAIVKESHHLDASNIVAFKEDT